MELLIKFAIFVLCFIACYCLYNVGYCSGYNKGYIEGIWSEIEKGATVIFGKDKGTKCPMCGQERK